MVWFCQILLLLSFTILYIWSLDAVKPNQSLHFTEANTSNLFSSCMETTIINVQDERLRSSLIRLICTRNSEALQECNVADKNERYLEVNLFFLPQCRSNDVDNYFIFSAPPAWKFNAQKSVLDVGRIHTIFLELI